MRHPKSKRTGEPMVPVAYLDLDGTVRWGKDQLGKFVNDPEDVVIFPEALIRMHEWKERGGRIIGVSNQGGVALGYMSAEECEHTMIRTYHKADQLFDKIAYCTHHPDADDPEESVCWCRKPAPGLVIETACDLAQMTGEIYPPHLAVFVGDREEDRICAKRVNMRFIWAADWREEGWEYTSHDYREGGDE